MTPGRLGFAGLGQMGRPMAANIVKGGFPLVVFGRLPEGTSAIAAGAT